MIKKIWVLSEIQDEDKYILEAFDSYEKAEEAKEEHEAEYEGYEYEIEECDLNIQEVENA